MIPVRALEERVGAAKPRRATPVAAVGLARLGAVEVVGALAGLSDLAIAGRGRGRVLVGAEVPLELEAAEPGRPSAARAVLRAVGAIIRDGASVLEAVDNGGAIFEGATEDLSGPASLLRAILGVGRADALAREEVEGRGAVDLGMPVVRERVEEGGGEERTGRVDLASPRRRWPGAAKEGTIPLSTFPASVAEAVGRTAGFEVSLVSCRRAVGAARTGCRFADVAEGVDEALAAREGVAEGGRTGVTAETRGVGAGLKGLLRGVARVGLLGRATGELRIGDAAGGEST